MVYPAHEPAIIVLPVRVVKHHMQKDLTGQGMPFLSYRYQIISCPPLFYGVNSYLLSSFKSSIFSLGFLFYFALLLPFLSYYPKTSGPYSGGRSIWAPYILPYVFSSSVILHYSFCSCIILSLLLSLSSIHAS